jgi:hypothetical protein
MGSRPDTVEKLLQAATQTGVLGKRMVHQKLGHLVITGFDWCLNFELLILKVLPVWGHDGVGCAGVYECSMIQSSQTCIDAIYSMSGYPLGICY